MTNEETNTQNVKVLSERRLAKVPGGCQIFGRCSGSSRRSGSRGFPQGWSGISDCEVCITCTRKDRGRNRRTSRHCPAMEAGQWGSQWDLSTCSTVSNEYENSVVTNEEAAEASDSESTPPSEEGQANHE
jgi:hypothetical protein